MSEQLSSPWLASYPPGTPPDIQTLPDDSIVKVMEEACRVYAGRTAYLCMGKGILYAELEQLSLNFARWLQLQGLTKGMKVALMMPNVLQYPLTLFGVLRAGGVVVNCNPLYTPRELEFQLKDSEAEFIVVLENFAHTVQSVLPRTRVKHVVVTSVGELLGLRGVLVDSVLRWVRKAVPHWHIPHAVRLSQTLKTQGISSWIRPALQAEDMAFLQYTGGTTGHPKGAMLTHGNIVANLKQVDAWLKDAILPGQELVVTALPLYHIFALTANCMVFMHMGATNLLIPNPRDIPAFVKALSRQTFTAITGVNTLFNALLNNESFTRLDFSRMKICMGGGMAVQREVAERWKKVTGHPITQAYGLTETSPGVTINPFTLQDFNGSIGLPIPSTTVSIRDESGRDLPVGEEGEICVRGPQVMKGYWHRADETHEVFHPDGFLRTGDLGKMNAEGYVFLLDRKKDMIKVSGFNVYPNEVEDVVAHHPGVREVAAIGVEDPHSGQAIKLFVVRKDQGLTTDDLLNYCRTQLTGYKIPRHVEFREELPHTNVGKILRRALKEDSGK